MNMMEGLTDEQVMEQIEHLAGTATVPDEKHNAHTFLNAVATSTDTTKTGFLREEEVGIPKLSSRTLKELALFCNNIADEQAWGEYFLSRSEILTSTSLSKEAKLLELAIVNRREVSNLGRKKVVKKTWTGKEKVIGEV